MTSNLASEEIAAHALQLREEARDIHQQRSQGKLGLSSPLQALLRRKNAHKIAYMVVLFNQKKRWSLFEDGVKVEDIYVEKVCNATDGQS